MRGAGVRWLAVGLCCAFACTAAPTKPDGAPPPIAAPKRPTVSAGGHVIRVLSPTTVVISRGSRDGLFVGRSDLTLHPLLPSDDGKNAYLDTNIRVARGTVAATLPDQATLTLSAVAAPITVGTFLQYELEVPVGYDDDAVFEVAAFDIEFRTLDEDLPLFTLADVLAAPPVQGHARVVQAMLAEIAKTTAMAQDVFKVRIEGGTFHGMGLGDAFARTKPEHVEAFLAFVRAFPGKYIAHRWKFVETYATWIINRTPSGDRAMAERKAAPLIQQGKDFAADGDFEQAAVAWHKALALLPDHEGVKSRLKSLETIRICRDALAKDPDDTVTRWRLVGALFDRSAHGLVGQELTILEKAGYKPLYCKRYRAMMWVREKRYELALPLLQALEKSEIAADVQSWLLYCTQMVAIKADPRSYAAQLALAKMHETDKHWDDAVAGFSAALDAAQTPQELATAHNAQLRIAAIRDIDKAAEWAQEAMRHHNRESVQDKLQVILRKCKQIDDMPRALRIIDKLASLANETWQERFAVQLRQEQLAFDPTNGAAWLDLAWVQHGLDHNDEAAEAVAKGLKLLPESLYAHQILAQIALDAGDLVVAQAEAEIACKDKAYPWPRQVLAQIAAERGQWDEAVAQSQAAWQLKPEQDELRNARTGALWARQAVAEIARNRDVDRQRLRLVRALIWMDVPRAVAAATEAIGKDSRYWLDARRSLAEATGKRLSPALRADAARDLPAKTPTDSVLLERCLAAQAYAAKDQPATRLRMAKALVAQGQPNRALATLGTVAPGTPAADVAELARRALEADATSELARQAAERSEFATAQRLYEQAWELQKTVAPLLADRVIYYVAAQMVNRGLHQEALALVDRELQRLRLDGESVAVLELSSLRGDVLAVLGNLQARWQAAEAGMKWCDAQDNVYCLANLNDTLGRVHLNSGRLAQARHHFTLAIALADQTGNERQELNIKGSLADLYLSTGEYAPCRKIAEDLLVRSRKLDDAYAERTALMLLGAAGLYAGDARLAVRRFGEVYALGVRTGDTWVRAMARLWEGKAQLEGLHDPKAAVPLLRQAVDLYGAMGDNDGLGRSLLHLGNALGGLKQFDEARTALDRALHLAQIGQRQPLIARVFTQIAETELDAAQPAVALPAAQSACVIADALDVPENQYAAQHALANALDHAKRPDEAFAAHEKAVTALVEMLSRSGGEAERDGSLGVGRTREVFQDAIDFCMRTARIEKALEWLELSRDATLRRIFDPSRLKVQDKAAQQTLDKLRQAEEQAAAAQKQLREELAKPQAERNQAVVEALGKEVAHNDKELRQLMVQLNAKNPRMYNNLSIKAEHIRELQKSLPEGTLVVEYFSADDALYTFVISKEATKPRAVKIEVGAVELERAVFDWRATVQARNPAVRGRKRAEVMGVDPATAPQRNKELGQKLYKWLVAPIAADLAAAKQTMIVPYGPLYYLPIHALETTGKDGKAVYAIEQARLGYLSSATRFALGHGDSRPPRTLLAFANPDGSLPGAHAEVARIQKQAFADAKVFYEGDATKERFLQLVSQYRIVHFATHGILAADATASHLKMAGDPLTVFEINGLDSLEGKTDLVVLSACETALQLGKSSGEELISIASAFATAGAPSLVASLWEVDDESTSELMTEFYRLLKAGKDSSGKDLDTLEALRLAQLHVLHLEKDGVRPFADPAYWAAFQLIGDYR